MMKRKCGKRFVAVLLLSALIFSGCGRLTVNWVPGRKIVISDGKNVLTDRDVLLIALQYKCECESFYGGLLGKGFFSMPVTADEDFETYVKEFYIFAECRAILYLLRTASEEELTVGYEEDQNLRKAASDYVKELTEDELRFSHADEESVYELLRKYALANAAVEYLIRDTRPEISAEESRVADIEIIHVKDEASAESLRERFLSGENFLSLARENTVDDFVSRSVARSDLIPSVSDAVFALKDGEVSEVLPVNGEYFLIRVDKSYNSILSGKNRLNLMALRRFRAWEPIYDLYSDNVRIERNESEWNRISLKKYGEFRNTGLFRVFSGEVEF